MGENGGRSVHSHSTRPNRMSPARRSHLGTLCAQRPSPPERIRVIIQ